MNLVAAGLMALGVGVASVVPAPSDLLSVIDGPDGYELADIQTGLTFDEYAELEPDAVAHIDTGAEMSAAVDVWTSGEEDIMLRQVTRWGDAAAAAAYVAQADVVARADGLNARDALFGSAIEYTADDANGIVTHLIAWSQGRLAISIEVFSLGPDRTATLHEQAEAFAAEITMATGVEPVADGPVTTEATSASPAATGGGIPIGKVLLWLAIIIGGIWAFSKLRKKLKAVTPGRDDAPGRTPADQAAPDEPKDVDDVIERARAESRARREVEEASGPELGEDWKIPDDY